jgi:hypothetical protein
MLPHHTVHPTRWSLISNVHTMGGRGGGYDQFGSCRTFFFWGGGSLVLGPIAHCEEPEFVLKKSHHKHLDLHFTYIYWGDWSPRKLSSLWGVTLEAKYMSADPVRCFIFCSISIFLPACLVTGTVGDPSGLLVQQGMYSTIPIHWNIKSSPASPGRSRVGPALYVFSLLGRDFTRKIRHIGKTKQEECSKFLVLPSLWFSSDVQPQLGIIPGVDFRVFSFSSSCPSCDIHRSSSHRPSQHEFSLTSWIKSFSAAGIKTVLSNDDEVSLQPVEPSG